MSNLDHIGFKINSAEDFESLVSNIFDNGIEVDVDEGKYMVYTDESGAELYAQIDVNSEFVGFMPFYDSSVTKTVKIQGEIKHAEATALDTRCQAMSEENTYPFVFELVNAKTKKLEPGTVNLPFVAIPNEIRYFETEAEFMDELPELSLTYFIPVGLMNQEGEASENPEPYAMFVGKIKSVEHKTNEFSGGEFYVLEVSALEGDLTIVTAVSSLDKEPKVDGFVNGVFWMSAKV